MRKLGVSGVRISNLDHVCRPMSEREAAYGAAEDGKARTPFDEKMTENFDEQTTDCIELCTAPQDEKRRFFFQN
jgi:hypothetical protein